MDIVLITVVKLQVTLSYFVMFTNHILSTYYEVHKSSE